MVRRTGRGGARGHRHALAVLDERVGPHDDGVLTITIPVVEQAKPDKVEVTRAGGAAQALKTAAA